MCGGTWVSLPQRQCAPAINWAPQGAFASVVQYSGVFVYRSRSWTGEARTEKALFVHLCAAMYLASSGAQWHIHTESVTNARFPVHLRDLVARRTRPYVHIAIFPVRLENVNSQGLGSRRGRCTSRYVCAFRLSSGECAPTVDGIVRSFCCHWASPTSACFCSSEPRRRVKWLLLDQM